VPNLTVDELATEARVPVRTIREYQTLGLLPGPERSGRIGIYADTHVHRLALIARLQERGYSLAGIKDLLSAWRDGADLTEVLGIEPDQLVHIDEPGAPATVEQLERLLPSLIPVHLDRLEAIGIVARLGAQWCVPSPSLLQLTVDMVEAGVDTDATLDLLGVIGDATDAIATATTSLLDDTRRTIDPARLGDLTARGRGLLAHGTGRLTIHKIGSRLERQ
jgi:DNA-binding transcriptional MerR regulator